MKDSYGREIDYMRISITDRCNLRCRYCMPDSTPALPGGELLTYEEIVQVCWEAAALGITRFKITGGEPLVRLDAAKLIGKLKGIPGVEAVTLTTNGVLLSEHLKELHEQGLDAVNISLDTLDERRYREITGFDALPRVLEGFYQALETGMKVKINTVLQADRSPEDWQELVLLARDHPVDVRFIELMPIGTGRELQGVSNPELQERIAEIYPGLSRDRRIHGNGPAVYYRIPGFSGSIGFISAIHGKFCESCNRLRMSAAGELKPCLCYGGTVDVKTPLRRKDLEGVRQALREAILKKPEAHCFKDVEGITERRRMVSIGG